MTLPARGRCLGGAPAASMGALGGSPDDRAPVGAGPQSRAASGSSRGAKEMLLERGAHLGPASLGNWSRATWSSSSDIP
eukprot:8713444-Pyramimonas_sp.AAC.1